MGPGEERLVEGCLWWTHVMNAFSDTLRFVNGGDKVTILLVIELRMVCDRVS